MSRALESLGSGAPFFLVGVLASALVSGLLTDALEWSFASVAFITAVLAVASIARMQATHRRVAEILDFQSASVSYVPERYDPEKGIESAGVVHERFIEIVSQARNEILVVTADWIAQSALRAVNVNAYERHLEEIELAIQRNPSFNYVRLLQDPPGASPDDLPSVGLPMIQHCNRCLRFQREKGRSTLNVDILRVSGLRSVSFLLVDHHFLFIIVDELDSQGTPYMAGTLLIEDRRGDIVKHWKQRFSNLQIAASRIPAEVLESASKTL